MGDYIDLMERSHKALREGKCGCYMCIGERGDAQVRMGWCSCGNKRCPHSSDHRNACTNSNDPGQPGSIYALTSPADKGAE